MRRAPGKLGASDFHKCAYAVICDFLTKRSCIVLILTKGPVAPAIDAAKKSDAAALNVLASPSPLLQSGRWSSSALRRCDWLRSINGLKFGARTSFDPRCS